MPGRGEYRVCSTPGCPEYTRGGKCEDCRRSTERKRGTATQRGYGGRDWQAVRGVVLERDPQCVCADEGHDHGSPCGQPSTVADHHPDERRDLVAAGVPDPDAPHRLRGVCASCHNRKKAAETPGGWHRRE
jgi:5-methylcytosine-specific restriction protein A